MPQLLAILELAEGYWKKSKSEEERHETESLAVFVIIGFCLSMYGREVPLVVIEGMLEFWGK